MAAQNEEKSQRGTFQSGWEEEKEKEEEEEHRRRAAMEQNSPRKDAAAASSTRRGVFLDLARVSKECLDYEAEAPPTARSYSFYGGDEETAESAGEAMSGMATAFFRMTPNDTPNFTPRAEDDASEERAGSAALEDSTSASFVEWRDYNADLEEHRHQQGRKKELPAAASLVPPVNLHTMEAGCASLTHFFKMTPVPLERKQSEEVVTPRPEAMSAEASSSSVGLEPRASQLAEPLVACSRPHSRLACATCLCMCLGRMPWRASPAPIPAESHEVSPGAQQAATGDSCRE